MIFMFNLKVSPIAFFSLKKAFSALSRKSSIPVLISPDGVRRNPKYLNFFTFSCFGSKRGFLVVFQFYQISCILFICIQC